MDVQKGIVLVIFSLFYSATQIGFVFGDGCELQPTYCTHGACINTSAGINCSCFPGYTGAECSLDIDECSLEYLNHTCIHGTCTNTIGGYVCSCHRGFTGRSCNIDIDECNAHPGHNLCANNGTCVNIPGRFYCNCTGGWSIPSHCHRDIDECSESNPCRHGRCQNTPGSYNCVCSSGWTGKDCDVDMCPPCIYGTCNNASANYTCMCHSGWTGPTCSTDIDECSGNHTCVHGTCTNLPGSYTCTCGIGWTGPTCSVDVNECVQRTTCLHGSCTNLTGGYSCRCDTGWQGSNCDIDINDCLNGTTCRQGVCSNTTGAFKCLCYVGWSGRHCELDINECSNRTACQHGICRNTVGSYMCQCNSGWQGQHCGTDINECMNKTMCQHGVCTNTEGSYMCQCEAGWTGKHCDQLATVNNTGTCQLYTPCVHGHCNSSHDGYVCTCAGGWTGVNCTVDIDECVGSNPCGDNRTCFNTPGSYNCTAQVGPQGLRLEDAIIVSCDDVGWTVTVDMHKLRLASPGARASDIYLGDNSCTGTEVKGQLVFRRALDECLTTTQTVNGNVVYSNELVYAERDPLLPFRIKHYNWTVSVECDVHKNQSTTVHVHHDLQGHGEHHVTGNSHYSVNMSFYSDSNFLSPVPGNPLHVPVGTRLYVKVFSTVPDWTLQMKVQACYTKPGPDAPAKYYYYIIKNGCEVDVNTHIISQSTHETRFVFEDFEYTTNHEGIYVSCDATFCAPNDVTPLCRLTCDPSDAKPIV